MTVLKPGERLVNRTPGGGGYGPAFRRLPEAVARDVRDGLVSPQGAELDYGVVLSPAGEVDHDATAQRRQTA